MFERLRAICDVSQRPDLVPVRKLTIEEKVVDKVLKTVVLVECIIYTTSPRTFLKFVEVLKVPLGTVLHRKLVAFSVKHMVVLELVSNLDHLDIAIDIRCVQAQCELMGK